MVSVSLGPDTEDPTISSALTGVVVPIPTFLELFTTRPFPPTVRSDENRFVELAVVAKKFVLVAFVVVAFVEVELTKVMRLFVVSILNTSLPL